jgi:hypothetical protein
VIFFVLLLVFFFLSFCLCVCVGSYGKEGQEQLKREERDKEEEQLEEVSLLQSSPYKPTMVVEVCCHRHELSIVVKVYCLQEDFLLSVF